MLSQPFHISRSRFRLVLTLGVLGISLAACSSPPSLTYDLAAVKQLSSPRAGASRGQLVIYEPGALAVYDSDRIVIKGMAQGLTYLPGAQWADRLPKLVQTRMIQSFENANRFKSVGRPGDRISATTALTTEIRSFQIEEQGREAVVEISAKLIGQGSGRIQAAQLFSTRVPAGTIDGAGASAALDEALRGTLAQIVAWAAR